MASAMVHGTPQHRCRAMTDGGRHYDYPPAVRLQVHDEKVEEYEQAAQFLNARPFDVVCLQHEFGIFGGEAGNRARPDAPHAFEVVATPRAPRKLPCPLLARSSPRRREAAALDNTALYNLWFHSMKRRVIARLLAV